MRHDSTGLRGLLDDAVLLGVGPLIRPELALYAVVPLAVLARAGVVRAGPRLWPRAGALAAVVACAAALPLSYQIFRMGYYAAIGPNTAVAKEAFLENFTQGRCYFENFFGAYRMGWPLAAAAAFWVARLRAHAAARRWTATVVTLAPTLPAALHVYYVVRVGGDYMHGRMLLPPVFAGLAPVAMVPLVPWPRLVGKVVLGAAGLALCVWIPACAIGMRIGQDNVCDIGDERGWYARTARVDHPVLLDDYREHTFFGEAQTAMQRAYGACPSLSSKRGLGSGPGCRLLHLTDEEQKAIVSPSATLPLATEVDPRIGAVESAGAVGIFGYLLPSSVHVVDRHGLADPLTARREILTRGRPGHEKTMPAPWMVARFTEPAPFEDSAVTAARHVLQCGPVAALEHAVTGPLTLRAFMDNLEHASDYWHLRISPDPFEAESKFCGTPRLAHSSTGGAGGGEFYWRCPSGLTVSRLRGTYSSADGAIPASLRPSCGGDEAERRESPVFGGESTEPFEVACPLGSAAVGIHGASDHLVRSVGLSCSRAGDPLRTVTGGQTGGAPFSLTCPDGTVMVGVEGRAGALVDAFGIVCSAPGLARAP